MTRWDRVVSKVLLCVVLTSGLGCKGNPAPSVRPEAQSSAQDGGATPGVPFEVRAGAAGMVFTWFDPHGGPHIVTRVEDVPAERRGAVRVDPPRPEQREAGWVYVANLTTLPPSGLYPVRAMRAEQLATELAALTGVADQGTPEPQRLPAAAPPLPPGTTVAQANGAQVIIYGASWCGACHQAAAYLRSRHVAFVEKDIEQDPAAQAEMVQKAQRAGIPLGSIPIIDVRGRMMQGFSAPALDQALAGS